MAPLLREWWLKAHNMFYEAQLPALCHQYQEDGIVTDNLAALAEKASAQPVTDMAAFCGEYLQIFNVTFL